MIQILSIQDVEKFAATKAATLRVWERRYNLLTPNRDSGNNRNYTIDDLETILNIVLLRSNGYKISKIAELTPGELKNKVAGLHHFEDRCSIAINRLIICMLSTDFEAFENTLISIFSTFEIEKALQNVLLPFMERVNVLSYSRLSNEAHIAITCIRQKLIYCIENLKQKNRLDKTVLLFLPQGEHYDLMLLYMYYILKKQGFKIIYLGTNIPVENLLTLIKNKQIEYLFTYATPENKIKIKLLSSSIRQVVPKQKIHVVGSGERISFNDEQQPEHYHYISYQTFHQEVQSA